jgi:hypothetical protein
MIPGSQLLLLLLSLLAVMLLPLPQPLGTAHSISLVPACIAGSSTACAGS